MTSAAAEESRGGGAAGGNCFPDRYEDFIRRAAQAAGADVPEAEICSRFEAEGCDPETARFLVVAGRQLSQQQERDFFRGGQETMKMFPILIKHEERRGGYSGPTKMPWAMLQPHEAWAQRNHGGQSLEMLASRGGLGPDEALAILDNRKWKHMPLNEAGAELQRRIDAFSVSGASEASCHVCQPFTKLVRDEAKFTACMKRAESIGELSSAKAIYELVREDMTAQDQENFICVCVDMRGQLRDYILVGRGQRHRVAVDIEDIIRPIILSGCDGAIVCHGHPSGVAEPSDADGDLTKAIKEGMAVACPTVHLLDHIVCGLGQFYSFAENDWKVDGKVTKVKS
jgi:hypothetical protein